MSLKYFNKGLEENLPTIQETQEIRAYVTTDEHNLYFDIDNKRIEISDIIEIDNDENLPTENILNKFYFSKATGTFFKYINNSWQKVTGGVSSYTDLNDLPYLNSIEFKGNMTLDQLGIASKNTVDNILNGDTIVPIAEEAYSALVANSATNATLISGQTLDYIMNYDNLTNKPNIGATIVVDEALSDTSTNPVQNRVVYEELKTVIEITPNPGSGGYKSSKTYAEILELVETNKRMVYAIYNGNFFKLFNISKDTGKITFKYTTGLIEIVIDIRENGTVQLSQAEYPANQNFYGGVKAQAATANDTVAVLIGSDGFLRVHQSGLEATINENSESFVITIVDDSTAESGYSMGETTFSEIISAINGNKTIIAKYGNETTGTLYNLHAYNQSAILFSAITSNNFLIIPDNSVHLVDSKLIFGEANSSSLGGIKADALPISLEGDIYTVPCKIKDDSKLYVPSEIIIATHTLMTEESIGPNGEISSSATSHRLDFSPTDVSALPEFQTIIFNPTTNFSDANNKTSIAINDFNNFYTIKMQDGSTPPDNLWTAGNAVSCILQRVQPEAEGGEVTYTVNFKSAGGLSLNALINPAAKEQILNGYQAYNDKGVSITGNVPIKTNRIETTLGDSVKTFEGYLWLKVPENNYYATGNYLQVLKTTALDKILPETTSTAATSADILTSKVAYNRSGELLDGSMPNYGGDWPASGSVEGDLFKLAIPYTGHWTQNKNHLTINKNTALNLLGSSGSSPGYVTLANGISSSLSWSSSNIFTGSYTLYKTIESGWYFIYCAQGSVMTTDKPTSAILTYYDAEQNSRLMSFNIYQYINGSPSAGASRGDSNEFYINGATFSRSSIQVNFVSPRNGNGILTYIFKLTGG